MGAIGLVALSAVWAGAESDSAALDRQRQLVNTRLREQVSQVTRGIEQLGTGYLAGQEGTTVLSRTAVSAFGYDHVFIVDANAQLAMNSSAETAARYRWMRPLLLPLIRQVRSEIGDVYRPVKSESSSTGPGSADFGIRGTSDLMRLEGRPTIVGVVPVRAASVKDKTGSQFLIAIRFLDGAALDELSEEQGLNGARFARTADSEGSEVAFQIDATSNGEPIGFIVWQPDLPGSRVIGRLMPSLSIAALAIAVMFSVLLMRLQRSLANLKQSEYASRQLALHDVLTGLPNRALFATRLDECLKVIAQSSERAAVALIDLDRFKAVNDTFGHAAGDELIRAAVERMLAVLRPDDTLARLGGDEFALLLRNVGHDEVELAKVCGRIIKELTRPFDLADGRAIVQVGGSMGVATIPDDGRNADDLMRYADLALYEVKTQGRGQWRLFQSSMAGGRRDREVLQHELRDVLSKGAISMPPTARSAAEGNNGDFGNLEVFYQSVHQAKHGNRVAGAEALVRWRHTQRGLLTPGDFVAVAEEGGLIDVMGLWVLKEACKAATQWQNDTFVAVNVSASQLKRREFYDEVATVLADTGLTPSRLELELTESSLIDDSMEVKSTLKSLRQLGVLLSLDDFGTGYSGLGYLIKFDIDRIKIDRSFVSLLGNGGNGLAIVNAIVALGHSLDLSVTAEGVETVYQRDLLMALGCDLQGYLFSKPAPIDQLRQMFPSGSFGNCENKQTAA